MTSRTSDAGAAQQAEPSRKSTIRDAEESAMCFKETKIPKRRKRSNGSLIPHGKGEKRCQIGRPLRLKIKLGAGDGMAELKPGRMQRLPRSSPFKGFGGSSLGSGHSPTSPGSIDRIAHDRVAHMGQMHPDLMGPAGVE